MLILTALVGFNPRSEAHGGGLDKHGGHNNRKEGNYHFHKGPLKGIVIALETRSTPYDRSNYPYSQNLEEKIIERQGGIFSPYILRCFSERGEVEIEHIVSLSEAHESGMSTRPQSEMEKFASDLDNLTLASPGVNRSKGGKDPSEWL